MAKIVAGATKVPENAGACLRVELDLIDTGLDEISYAKCEDLKSVSDRCPVVRLGRVNDEAPFGITRSVRFPPDL